MRTDAPIYNRLPMERNPYAPPGSVVAYDESGSSRSRPVAIRRALILMWASLALGPVSVAIDWSYLQARTYYIGLIVISVVWLAFNAWLIVKAGAARNWARICYLAMCVVGHGFALFDIEEEAARAPLLAGIDLIMLGMDLGAIYLLFFPGGEWFRTLPVART